MKSASKKTIEHWLFDPHAWKIDKSPIRQVSSAMLTEFLNRSGESHRGYYHYTSLSALRGILNSHSFLLSRGENLNDQIEPKNCNPKLWQRTYLASFSFGGVENFGMWEAYGKKRSEAIRLGFTKRALLQMKKCASSKDSLFAVIRCGVGQNLHLHPLPDNVSIETVSLHDVIYQYGEARYAEDGTVRRGTMLWNRRMATDARCRAFSDAANCPALATYVKDVLWSNEFEVRLVVTLSCPCPNIHSLAVKFGAELFDDLAIRTGPGFSARDELESILSTHGLMKGFEQSPFRVLYK